VIGEPREIIIEETVFAREFYVYYFAKYTLPTEMLNTFGPRIGLL
jgi:hypothetical protein